MIVASLESAEIWSEKTRCSSKIKPRFRAEWVVVREESCILESCCLYKSDKKKFSFRRVESKKIGSHSGRDMLQSVL